MVKETAVTREDLLVRGVLRNGGVRFVLADATDTVTKGVIVHDADPVGAHCFGRALVVGALLSPLLAGTEKYSVRWEYAGAISSILVDVDAQGRVRGIPKVPHLAGRVESEKELYGGGGTITVVKSVEGKILASGSTKAALLDIVDDVALHFSTSDQVETDLLTRLEFTSDPERPVAMAAGFMLQAMPGCDFGMLSAFRKAVRSEEFGMHLARISKPEDRVRRVLGSLFRDWDAGRKEDVLRSLAFDMAAAPSYTCTCSSQGMKELVLTLLEPEDLYALVREENGVHITCHFCNRRYSFAEQDLRIPGGTS